MATTCDCNCTTTTVSGCSKTLSGLCVTHNGSDMPTLSIVSGANFETIMAALEVVLAAFNTGLTATVTNTTTNAAGIATNVAAITLLNTALPAYADDAAAGIGGLSTGDKYQTDGTGAAPLNAVGIVMVKQ